MSEEAETTTPEPEQAAEPQGIAPAEILPDADDKDLRSVIRELRDENKKRRQENKDILQQFTEVKGTAEERLDQLQTALAEQQERARRAEFSSLAVQAGIDANVAGMLDINRFNMDNVPEALEQLKALNLAKPVQPLPNAGKPVNPAKPENESLTTDMLLNLSPEEWEESLPEILKMKRDTPYR